jgi:hypothetical protein
MVTLKVMSCNNYALIKGFSNKFQLSFTIIIISISTILYYHNYFSVSLYNIQSLYLKMANQTKNFSRTVCLTIFIVFYK